MNRPKVFDAARVRLALLVGIGGLWLFLLTLYDGMILAGEPINFRVILVKSRGEAEEILSADPGELREEFYTALMTLSPGEVSPLIPVADNYAILKREAANPSKDAWKKADEQYKKALRLASQRDFDAANVAAHGALKLYPNHNAARYVFQITQGVLNETFDRSTALQIFEAITLAQEGFPQKAQESLEKLARSNPNVPEIHVAFGEVYMLQGNFSEAIGAYEKALSSAEWATLAHLYLGAGYLQQGNLAEALSHYQKTIARDIGLAQGHLGLGLVYMSMGKAKEALGEIQVALAIDPHLDSAYDHFGMLLIAGGNVPDAVWAFEKALAIRPDYPTYLNHLGFAYNRWGIFSKAVETLERALSLAPEDPMVHNNLAMAYYDSGQMDEAIHHADRAKALNYPVHPDFLAKLEPYRKGRTHNNR
jgi:tetratricopeptide (TPR) repeat protein